VILDVQASMHPLFVMGGWLRLVVGALVLVFGVE
jgi:hypothetical protein